MNERMNERTNERTNEQMNERMNEWMNECNEVFPDLIDMKFPDRSSSSRKKPANKIEIDFNSLLAQGLQRDRDKEAKKQEKKERRRRAQKAAGGPKDVL